MSSDEIAIFEPEIENGPKKIIILTEHDSIEDYNWALNEFSPDITYILYPSLFFEPYFRTYKQLLKAHTPDNIGFNSALYALTTNKYGFGFYNSLWRRLYAYLTETESLLNACENHELYFQLSNELLNQKHLSKNANNKLIIGPTSSIDRNGLFIRGVRNYVINMLFDDKTDIYDKHFTEYSQHAGQPIPKHQYFLELWHSYKDRDNEHEFWEYLVTWRDMIYWDYVTDSNAYLPQPHFTKILKKSNELYPNDELRHLPFNTCYRSLVHDTFTNLQQMNDIENVLLIVPTNGYVDHFMDLYGNTTDLDLIYGAKFDEFDNFIHPRMKPIIYSGIGIGIGYYFNRKQHEYKNIVWKRRMFRMAKWSANGTTAAFLGAYWLGTCYFNLISGHSYCNQSIAKRINDMKTDVAKLHTRRKWTDYLFRKFHGVQ
eukprot:92297_1